MGDMSEDSIDVSENDRLICSILQCDELACQFRVSAAKSGFMSSAYATEQVRDFTAYDVNNRRKLPI